MLDCVNVLERETERQGQLVDEQERLRSRTYGFLAQENVELALHNNTLAANIAALPVSLRLARAEAICRNEASLRGTIQKVGGDGPQA